MIDIKREVNLIIDEIKQIQKEIDIETHLKYIFELEEEIKNILHYNDSIKKIKELKTLKSKYLVWHELYLKFQDLDELIDLLKEQEIILEYNKLKKEFEKLKENLLFSDKHDHLDVFLSIQSGAGGKEACDWTTMLYRMYLRFCQKNNFEATTIDLLNAEGGIKSVSIDIKGINAYGMLKSETGVHRLVRISPFDSNKKRHTSFSSVLVSPQVEENELTVDKKDLRIDTYRSSGAGGQSVNTTDSAIRITHLPTNTVVTCQNERSQLRNKEVALKILYSRLFKLQQEKNKNNNKVEKKLIEWSSQIRNYVFHPYNLVKDLRTGHSNTNIKSIMDGDLEQFIYSFLRQYKT